MRLITSTACILTVALLTACGGGGTEQAGNSNGTDKPVEKTSGLPANLFLSAPPDNVMALGAVKQDAAIGDEVVFEGRIGGRGEPFVDGRATFLIADSSLKICSEIPGDTCKKPWDYCCEPRDNLLANTATVQIVDGEGNPLKLSLKGEQGLTETATVVVTGKVTAKDAAGTFVIDATGLYVRQG